MTEKIALAQFEIIIGDTIANLTTGLQAIRDAAAAGCRLVQLPELWISGYDLPNRDIYSGLLADWSEELQSLSNSLQIVIGGSVLTRQDGNFFNTYLLYQPGQTHPAQYQKTHLFRLLDEEKYLASGNQLTIVDLGWCKVGLALCYDLRFPELVRAYAERQIDILLVAAQWGRKRSEHWRVLVRARAIENQIFVAATNGVGPIFENRLAGYSAVADPWGKIIVEGGADQSVLLTAEIDLGEIARVREAVPSTTDRRTHLYQQWNDELSKL